MATRIEDTGIYGVAKVSFEFEAEARECLTLLATRPWLNTLDDWLDHYQEAVKAALKSGIKEPAAKDAREILFYLNQVRADLQRGQPKSAVYNALQVGRLIERLDVRPFEPMVKTGRNVRSGASKARTKKLVKSHTKYKGINAAVADRLKKRGRHRFPSLTQIREQVAADKGVSYNTVLRAAKTESEK